MSTFKPLKALTSRRQVLKAGLAALTLTGIAKQAQAKDESTLKTSNGHSKPKAKKPGEALVMLDPGHGGIDTGAIGKNGSKKNTSCWRLQKMCAQFYAATALTPV
jgi:N-acetylmuramoyl-L-alanine amidase